MRRILVYGYFGGRNFGDELMLIGYLNRHATSGDEIRIVTPDGSVPPHLSGRVKSGFPKTLSGFLRGVAWSTDFVLCGGTVFHDAYPAKRHTSYRKNLIAIALLLRLTKLSGNRVHLAAIGLGPLKRPLTRATARFALRSAGKIEVRDRRSLDEVHHLRSGRPVEQVRDLAHDALPRNEKCIAAQPDRHGLLLSLVPTRLVSTVSEEVSFAFYEKLAEAVAQFQLRTSEEICVLAICVGTADSDVAFAEEFAQILRQKGVRTLQVTHFDGDPSALCNRIAAARGLIAMRYHAATVAELMHVPTLWLAYQRKVIDGAEELGVPTERIGMPDVQYLTCLKNWLESI